MNDFQQQRSMDERYCYAWSVTADPSKTGTVLFVLLNPSNRDVVDQGGVVVRKCAGFAKRWGYGRVEAVNLFAYRHVSPEMLLLVDDPVGKHNDEWIRRHAARAQRIIVAWGNRGKMLERDRQVLRLLRGYELMCLGWTKQGAPIHPGHASYELDLKRYPFA